jgi:adenine-specific DNA methylase
MVQDTTEDTDESKELPIERGFPIKKVNQLAQKESRAKQWYRPIYTMHKWWARRLGCVFRAISLYTLVDDPEKVEIYNTGKNGSLNDFADEQSEIKTLIDSVDITDPESLWELYTKDVRISDKKILDPFMGGGTSLIEGSRFGVESDGYDLNPVAWFTTKKEIDAGQTDVSKIEEAFEQLEEQVADEILSYYKTNCPNGNHDADVMYNLWVKEINCVSCNATVPLFNDYRVGKGRYDNDDMYNVLCPNCEHIVLVDDWRSESVCDQCNNRFVPQDGPVSRGDYGCPECGQKYSVRDAIEEQDGFNLRQYAIEYYCPICDAENGKSRSETKGYKKVEDRDIELYQSAVNEWESTPHLHDFVPSESIPDGAATTTKFGGRYDGYDLPSQNYQKWTDMYNERQLLCLSKILYEIDQISDKNIREYMLLTFSESLNYNNLMVFYNPGRNMVTNIFSTNSFNPPNKPVENNLWGTKYGTGTFTDMRDMVVRGVEYANAPTERYIRDGETCETSEFNFPIGKNTSISCGDMRTISSKNEYDAVITDPPYYDNILYSELSDYFYVWQKIILQRDYEHFNSSKTSRSESIVANPAENKGTEEFEDELGQSFSTILDSLKSDGVLVFTYHHSNSESWGELLEALCDVGFTVSATYPINADMNKFTEGELVEFDIIVVARPASDRQPISWNSLRRNIVRTAKRTHQRLTDNRELSDGNIGVIEMGRAFHEYSKHHGEVLRNGEVMSAKEVVDEIYGIIQQGSDIGEVDVFLDLLGMDDPKYNDLNMLSRGTGANPDAMNNSLLYRMDDGEFILGTWDDPKRQAYIQEQVNGSSDNGLTPLEKAQFLRQRYEQGKSIQNYIEKWTVSDDLRELCGELAEASEDEVYNRILGGDRAIGDY